MVRESSITRHSAHELEDMEDQTDWNALDAMTEEELEAKIATDEEAALEWGPFKVGLPEGIGQPKKQLTVRFDADVVEWFKGQGKGYQTRMNAVLRQFMEHHKKRGE
jgi:uncharacterized protein (DUF4415 family)